MAKETFLSGLDLSEYALKASSGEDKDIAVMNIATMHFSLVHIYTEKNDINNVKKHLEQVEKLKLEYPFLNKLLESKMIVMMQDGNYDLATTLMSQRIKLQQLVANPKILKIDAPSIVNKTCCSSRLNQLFFLFFCWFQSYFFR